MAKETKLLLVRMSPGLKDDFKKYCQEDEVDMSDMVRDYITRLVRNRKLEVASYANRHTA